MSPEAIVAMFVGQAAITWGLVLYIFADLKADIREIREHRGVIK